MEDGSSAFGFCEVHNLRQLGFHRKVRYNVVFKHVSFHLGKMTSICILIFVASQHQHVVPLRSICEPRKFWMKRHKHLSPSVKLDG